MKELSIEQKAQRYDEVLRKAKDMLSYKEVRQEDMEYLFPELKESEDERIRKSILELVKQSSEVLSEQNQNNMIAWLEKQKDYIKLSYSAYTSNRDVIEFADKYSHIVWKNLMDKFKKNENYSIGCNDVSDIVLNAIINTYNWLEKQGKESSWKPSKEEMDVLYSSALEDDVRRRSTIQVLEYARSLDTYNQYGKADIDKNIAWLEKQDIFSKKDVDDAYLKGVRDTKNEIEKQYEANYQIRKDIATFIFNYKGDIKDRAKWMNYLGIKVSFVEKQGEKRHKFTIGDIIISDNNTTYRVENIVKNCIGQDSYFLVNVERENKGMRYFKIRDPRGKTYNFGEITWLCEQVDAKFEKVR